MMSDGMWLSGASEEGRRGWKNYKGYELAVSAKLAVQTEEGGLKHSFASGGCDHRDAKFELHGTNNKTNTYKEHMTEGSRCACSFCSLHR